MFVLTEAHSLEKIISQILTLELLIFYGYFHLRYYFIRKISGRPDLCKSK